MTHFNDQDFDAPEPDPDNAIMTCTRCGRAVDTEREQMLPQRECCKTCFWCEACVEADRMEREGGNE